MPYLLFGWIRVVVLPTGEWTADTGSEVGDWIANAVARTALQMVVAVERLFDVELPIRMVAINETAGAGPR